MKVLALCNGRLGFPAIQFLSATGTLTACITPETLNEETEELHHFCKQQHIALHTVSKRAFMHEMKEWLTHYQVDVVFVFTFPYIIPGELLTLPPNGFINFHYGLLPEYRGANAIFWEIKNREPYGGITVHRMTKELDKGPVYVKHLVPIQPDDSYGRHVNEVSYAAPKAIIELLNKLSTQHEPIPQDKTKAHYYKRPSFEDVCINWTKSASQIAALVNACNPWNKGAITILQGQPMRIIRASVVEGALHHPTYHPGEITCCNAQDGLRINCGDGNQLRIDICFFNNEFTCSSQIDNSGLQKGLRFNPSC